MPGLSPVNCFEPSIVFGDNEDKLNLSLVSISKAIVDVIHRTR